MTEVWAKLIYPQISDEDNRFEISTLGRLKNSITNFIYTPTKLNSGYLSVRTTLGSKKKKLHIILHKAVAYTFLSNPSNYPCVNHIDGDKTNNTIENLEWCTYGHNLQHAYDTMLFSKDVISGENNHEAKLTKEDVLYIRDNYIKGSRQFGAHALARKFNVTHPTILSIIHREAWLNI